MCFLLGVGRPWGKKLLVVKLLCRVCIYKFRIFRIYRKVVAQIEKWKIRGKVCYIEWKSSLRGPLLLKRTKILGFLGFWIYKCTCLRSSASSLIGSSLIHLKFLILNFNKNMVFSKNYNFKYRYNQEIHAKKYNLLNIYSREVEWFYKLQRHKLNRHSIIRYTPSINHRKL